MTRKEEIEQEMRKIEFANFYRQDGYEFGFQRGADWADRTMLDRICEWVEENFIDADENGVVKSYSFDSVKVMIDDLKKRWRNKL